MKLPYSKTSSTFLYLTHFTSSLYASDFILCFQVYSVWDSRENPSLLNFEFQSRVSLIMILVKKCTVCYPVYI